MKNKFLALLLALLLLAAPALALPSPSGDFYVLDEANVLSNSTEEYIIHNNDQLYDACGAQIVFVTVDNTEGEAIDDYTYDIFNKWGIGDPSKENGFLVLMAIGDDNYYAAPGTGLERAISAGTIKDLLDTYLEPDFAAKDYDSGAKALFDALFQEVCDASAIRLTAAAPSGSTSGKIADRTAAATRPAEDRAPARDDNSGISFGTIVFVIILIVILVSIMGGRSRRRRSAPPPHVPPMHTPPPPPRRPIIIPRIHVGPRPGPGPRPTNRNHSRPGGGSRPSGGGRSFGGGAGRSGGGFSRGGRSGGGGGSRGGGAGRGR